MLRQLRASNVAGGESKRGQRNRVAPHHLAHCNPGVTYASACLNIMRFDLAKQEKVLMNATIRQEAQRLLVAMTRDEKIDLVHGVDGMWTGGVPRSPCAD